MASARLTARVSFFSTPTPAAVNSNGFVIAGDVTLFHQRGYYAAPISLSFTKSEPSSTWVYTLGGSGPSGAYTRSDHWMRAINCPMPSSPAGGLLGVTGWFPSTGTNRTERMITKFKAETWSVGTAKKLPLIGPPDFLVDGLPRYGGSLANGQILTVGGGTGNLYVTTGGSDPRSVGGGVQFGLVPYTGGAIGVSREGIVHARWNRGGNRSALAEASFIIILNRPARPSSQPSPPSPAPAFPPMVIFSFWKSSTPAPRRSISKAARSRMA